MTNDERQRLNVRAIRVTLASARRHAPPARVGLCVARARQLLQDARARATAPSVISDIEALEAQLEGGGQETAHRREG